MMFLQWALCLWHALSFTSCGAFVIPHPSILSSKRCKFCNNPSRSNAVVKASLMETSDNILWRDSVSDISSASSRVDPLITSFLLRAVNDNTHPEADISTDTSFFRLNDAYTAMTGIITWETSLLKGRLPLHNDFMNEQVWPEEPLFSHVHDALITLGLQRLVGRHPQIITSVLLGVAKVVVEFVSLKRRGVLVVDDEIEENEEFNFEDEGLTLQYDEQQVEYIPLSEEELEQLAESLAEKLSQEWSGVVQGVSMLDSLFGYDHKMLDLKGEIGFGLHDGIWQHKGWEPIPSLQKKLSQMPELRNLLSQLGKRPSTSGKMNRFRPRKRSNRLEDMLGVEVDRFDPTSVSGLCYSSSLTTMLPSEAVFLQSRIKALRLLFLAKKAESKLLSYDLTGYTDVNTLPLPQKRRSVISPSAAGGPIIICLDTSWSMSGMREQLAKAVVLASVQAATRQGRECRVVSFSSANNAIESGTISCDANGVKRLLDFLQSSFGGGTDVTGALKYAIETLEQDMSSSDIILVSDGEIPNPPVSNVMMAKLESLRQQTGMEIHGLLVGKKESPALSALCTEVHDFLVDYEVLNYMNIGHSTQPPKQSLTALHARQLPKKSRSHISSIRKSMDARRNLSLYASRYSLTDDFGMVDDTCKLQRKKEIKSGKRQRRFLEDDEDWEWGSEEGVTMSASDDLESSQSSPTKAKKEHRNNDGFIQRLEAAYDSLRDQANQNLEKWSRSELVLEIEQSDLHSKRKILSDSISFVESGLIERDEQAKLVVLGMISQEHVLFIGPPGTSKSELGRRLSQLCGGPFFQRLFTRFTTPEEIFGPLSLRALENDEYLRCIDGFLPTATVGFLDEIFKANSSILNTLLTILNERQFDNGAGQRVICPLKCVIGASNELPESEELDALLDRFLLRAEVIPVSDMGLLQILTSQTNNVGSPLSVNIAADLERVVSSISSSIDSITMNENICLLIQKLRSFARDELNMYISDRRLVKAARLLRVSAAAHGRTRVDLVDCLLLVNVFWQIPEQQSAISEWLLDNLTPGNDAVEQSRFLLSGLASEALALIKKTSGDITGEFGARNNDLEAIRSVQKEIQQIQTLLQTHYRELERHAALVEDLPDHLFVSQDSANSAKQYLAPLAGKACKEVNSVRAEAMSLQLALTDAIENDLRSSLMEMLIKEEDDDVFFSEDELGMNLKEAKRTFDSETLRKWKSQRRKLS